MGLIINDSNKNHFITYARWAKILSLIGFFFVFLMILGGISIIAFGSVLNSYSQLPFNISYFGIFYLIIAGIAFYSCFTLYKSGNGFQKGIQKEDQNQFDLGANQLSKHFQFNGILTIVFIVLYIVMIFGFIIFGASMASKLGGASQDKMAEMETYDGIEEELDSSSVMLDSLSTSN